jgi:hypothetical protein
MEQQEPAVHQIEPVWRKPGPAGVGGHECCIDQTLRGTVPPGLFDLGRVQVDPGDAARWSNQGAKQPTHGAWTAAEVRNIHTFREARFEKRLATSRGIYSVKHIETADSVRTSGEHVLSGPR